MGRVVICLEIDKEFWPLEVSARNSHIILLPRVVELCETPINEAQLAVCVVNHYVMRLDIAVHDALRVAVVKRLEDLIHVVPDIVVSETLIEFAEVGIACVYELSNDRGSFGKRISDHVDEFDDVHTLLESLQNLDFS